MQIFLVEARQYALGDQRVIVPWVFGYTEAARVNRRAERRASRVLEQTSLGETAFWSEIASSAVSKEQQDVIRQVTQFARGLPGADIRWKRGPVFLFSESTGRDYLFAFRRNGNLELNILRPETERAIGLTEDQIARRQLFRAEMNRIFDLGLGVNDLRIFPQVSLGRWASRSVELQDTLLKVVGRG